MLKQVNTKRLNMRKWISLIMGILLILGSFMYMRDPMGATMSLVIAIGIIFIAMGVLKFIRYWTDELFRKAGYLIAGIIDFIFGFIIIYNKVESFIAFTSLIAFWVLFKGVINIANSFDLKRYGVKNWWLHLISGIIGVIAGFLLINNLTLSITYITIFISVSMFFNGILSIIGFFTIDDIVHKIKLRRKKNEEDGLGEL